MQHYATVPVVVPQLHTISKLIDVVCRHDVPRGGLSLGVGTSYGKGGADDWGRIYFSPGASPCTWKCVEMRSEQCSGECMVGHGVDIVDAARIRSLVERYAALFLNRVFTAAEQRFCGSMARPYLHYAGRWASKEAFYKALPDTLQCRARWKSVEILPPKAEGGRPALTVCDPALRSALCALGVKTVHLSISHDRDFCIASVILC